MVSPIGGAGSYQPADGQNRAETNKLEYVSKVEELAESLKNLFGDVSANKLTPQQLQKEIDDLKKKIQLLIEDPFSPPSVKHRLTGLLNDLNAAQKNGTQEAVVSGIKGAVGAFEGIIDEIKKMAYRQFFGG